MAAKKRRGPQPGRRQPSGAPPSSSAMVPADQGLAALDEMQRLLDAPLTELMGTPEEQAEAEELNRQAIAVPAMARLREVVTFVGKGRPATQAGNLKAPDAVALAGRLATGEQVPDDVRSIMDLPDTAHAFRWAAAAEFLARSGSRIVAGPLARDLERDPLAAWFKAMITLLEHGVLDGFRQGWRKSYVELLDNGAADLIVAVAVAGGRVPLSAIEAGTWEEVAGAYGYEPDDDTERAHVVGLLRAMVALFVDAGVMARHDDEVVLTGLGGALATIVAFTSDEEDDLDDLDLDDLDLVDTDAQTLLLVCAEEMVPGDARDHLLAWCEALPAEEAAAELCEAILDDDDPDIWDLGFDALDMINRAVAEPAVSRLRSHRGLRPLADAWLGKQGPAPRSPTPG